MSSSSINGSQVLSLISRLDKDAKGSFHTILLLGIIDKNRKTWGYQIKKELQSLIGDEYEIKDSTLYTSLNSLEKQYNLLISYNEDRRRYFELSKYGRETLNDIYSYWEDLIENSLILLRKIRELSNIAEKVE